VEVERPDRDRAPVPPGELLLPVDGVLHGIDNGLDPVVGDAIGKGRLAAGPDPAPGLWAGRHVDGTGIDARERDAVRRRGFGRAGRSRRLGGMRRGLRRRNGLRGLGSRLTDPESGAEEGGKHHRRVFL
jgi:hypothetical protein